MCVLFSFQCAPTAARSQASLCFYLLQSKRRVRFSSVNFSRRNAATRQMERLVGSLDLLLLPGFSAASTGTRPMISNWGVTGVNTKGIVQHFSLRPPFDCHCLLF